MGAAPTHRYALEELLNAVPEGWRVEHAKRADQLQYSRRSSYAYHLVGVQYPGAENPWANTHLPRKADPAAPAPSAELAGFKTYHAAMAQTDDWIDANYPKEPGA